MDMDKIESSTIVRNQPRNKISIDIELSPNGVWFLDDKHKICRFITISEIQRSKMFSKLIKEIREVHKI